MGDENLMRRSIIDKDSLPRQFPTHRHEKEFWEHLGRAIATFGFLEEVLGKAIFAFTATREYDAEEVEEAFDKWIPTLERALTDPLANLVDVFLKATKNHQDTSTSNIDELARDIKKAVDVRNMLCHASWRTPNRDGFIVPHFVHKKNGVWQEPVNIQYLKLVQKHVAELTCEVINTVTHMGLQFPGSSGPGKRIY
jgi:hypothetical protein